MEARMKLVAGEGEGADEEAQLLRSRATELLLREDWKAYIVLYSRLISHYSHQLSCSDATEAPKLQRALCSALANRADGRSKTKDVSAALDDCDAALRIDPAHQKSLLCRGKLLLDLGRYAQASDCFLRALAAQPAGTSDALRGLLDRSRRLETQSRNGAVDLSDWVLNGFDGKRPELAKYVGPVEIRRSESGGGRGLFATKNVEAGTVLVIAEAVVIGRGILPALSDDGSGDRAQLVMWKDFVDRILDATAKCSRTLQLLYTLSTGEDEESFVVPDINLFKEEENFGSKDGEPDVERILKVLDVNCHTEEGLSAKVLGKNSRYSGVGLWILPSFVNHSCEPNARRLHVGDQMIVHASRNVKAGDEITFAYFDVLMPLSKRREMAKRWGFQCNCQRCQFEEKACVVAQEMREIEKVLDAGGVIVRLEERMKKLVLKTKERAFLRASFWAAYACTYVSDRSMRKWGNRMPAEATLVESVSDAVGGDERILKVLLERLKRSGRGGVTGSGATEIERAMRLGRGVYGKVMKKQALRAMFELALVSACH